MYKLSQMQLNWCKEILVTQGKQQVSGLGEAERHELNDMIKIAKTLMAWEDIVKQIKLEDIPGVDDREKCEMLLGSGRRAVQELWGFRLLPNVRNELKNAREFFNSQYEAYSGSYNVVCKSLAPDCEALRSYVAACCEIKLAWAKWGANFAEHIIEGNKLTDEDIVFMKSFGARIRSYGALIREDISEWMTVNNISEETLKGKPGDVPQLGYVQQAEESFRKAAKNCSPSNRSANLPAASFAVADGPFGYPMQRFISAAFALSVLQGKFPASLEKCEGFISELGKLLRLTPQPDSPLKVNHASGKDTPGLDRQ